jgi:hypothetical protein
MAKQTIESRDILHASNERVKELDIVIKGSFVATSGEVSIDMPYGSMIGLFETPGEIYRFDYEAKEESMTVSYPYKTEDSIYAIIKANPQITPYIANAVIKSVQDIFEKTVQLMQACKELEDILSTDEKTSHNLYMWKYKYFMALENMLPSKDIALCTGIILSAYEYIQYLSPILSELIEKKSEYTLQIQMREEENGNSEAESSPANGEEEGYIDDEEDMPEALKGLMGESEEDEGSDDGETEDAGSDEETRDALNKILLYAGVDDAKADKFRTLIADYAALKDKTDTSDKARLLRRQLSEVFYDVYEAAFMRSIGDLNVSTLMKMFFYFGFVSEELAGEKNTRILKRLASNYKPDPEGNVLTAYEWLMLIYNGKVEPSKNEFDMEYPRYLKQQYDDGEIKQADMKRLLSDQKAKVSFELRNFIKNGSRMTFGRISSFVPVFSEESTMRSPDESMATWREIHEALDMVRRIDFSCFTRQIVFSNPAIGVNREFIDTEILPYIVLMPNGGSRSALWQEISGAHRDTPGRMMMPIFPEKEISSYIIRLSGEFRWEMCRREQGVHWNDVTVPSLTSMFSDYLQFYRKNHDLSPDLREKIKAQLQAARNSAKAVFVSDYINYLAFESSGSLRINRVSREIIFRFCPFCSEIRQKLSVSSPAYQKLIERYNIKLAQKKHLMEIVCSKIEKAGAAIPEEIKRQQEFMDK